jgi:Protein of unknown function (DUF1064).
LTKYNSSKVTAYGRIWDSKTEKDYYEYLLRLQKAGEVLEITIQPRCVILPKFERNGVKYKGIAYTPDFLVKHADGNEVYIDVKGMGTDCSKLRRKLFAYFIGKPLQWISASKKYSDTGWLDYDELQKIRRENRRKASV